MTRPASPQPDRQLTDALIALYQHGRYQELAEACHTMTQAFPESAFVWSTLGVALQQLGRPQEALLPMQKAVALSPREVQLHSNLGNTYSALGLQEQALASFRQALQLDKRYTEAHLNMGATLHDMGRFAEAEASYRRALQHNPKLAVAHFNLGNTLHALNRLDEAAASYRKALQLDPQLAGALANLGLVLQKSGKLEEAESTLRQALQLRPDAVEARSNLGSTLRDMGRLKEARQEYEQALRSAPQHPELLNNLGGTLHALGDLLEAECCYRAALAAKPDHTLALCNLGNTLQDMGRRQEAQTCFRHVLEHDPNHLKTRSSLLFGLNLQQPTDPELCLSEAKQYGAVVSQLATKRYNNWKRKSAEGKLRIGLVSGDFRNHPVGYFLLNVLKHLAPQRIELIAYPTFYKHDELTTELKSHCADWKPLYGLSDEAAARLIHNDGIDILIDLAGHTQHSRLPVFAWKPAPIQIAWLGYFATTGVAEIDYIIGDPYVAPYTESAHFTEQIWQLPECYWCFSPPEAEVAVSPLPALDKGYVTFGCFNNLAKMNDDVVALWAQILNEVPNSKLFLKYSQLNDRSICQLTQERYAAHGITPDRLILEGTSPRTEYLERYHQIDIALDPFPYPGGTTSMESLWMGVPVITLRGNRFLSHAGETILSNAGLPQWIAADKENYLNKAVGFATELTALAGLRATLRSQVLASPIFDGKRFALNLEHALQEIWKKKQEGNGKPN